MKHNTKGFTLVELLAVIGILAVVAIIATVSFSAISKRIKNGQYEAVLKSIKSSAIEYNYQTGEIDFHVQTLIDYGLLGTDDNNKVIVDPRNNKSMNCFEILFENEDNIKVIEKYSENGKCPHLSFTYTSLEVEYCNGEAYNAQNWKNTEICIKPVLPSDIDLTMVSSFEWKKDSDANYLYSTPSGEIRINAGENKPIDDIYQVSVTLKDPTITVYPKKVIVRIEQDKPQIEVLKTNNCTDSGVKINVNYKESEYGSGIKEGSLVIYSINNVIDSFTLPYDYRNRYSSYNHEFTIKDTNKYQLIVTDNAGNSNSKIININNDFQPQVNTIYLYDENKNLISNGSTVADTFMFKIMTNWINKDCKGTIYYCIDEKNTCTPETKIGNNIITESGKTSSGKYFIRYKSVNSEGYSTNVENVNVIIRLNGGGGNETPSEVDIKTPTITRYQIGNIQDADKSKLSSHRNIFSQGSNFVSTLSISAKSKYSWIVKTCNSNNVCNNSLKYELYQNGKKGFVVNIDNNTKYLLLGFELEDGSTSLIKYDTSNLEQNPFGVTTYFISFKTEIFNNNITINTINYAGIKEIINDSWYKSNVLAFLNPNQHTNFRQTKFMVKLSNNSYSDLEGNYYILNEEATDTSGIKLSAYSFGLDLVTNKYKNSKASSVTIRIDKTPPTINYNFIYNLKDLESAYAVMQCFQQQNNTVKSGSSPYSYKFPRPYGYKYDSSERDIDKGTCTKKDNNNNPVIKYIHYPHNIVVKGNTIIVHICSLTNHIYNYSELEDPYLIKEYKLDAHVDALSGIDLKNSTYEQIGYYDYKGDNMYKADGTHVRCNASTVPCVNQYVYTVTDNASNSARGVEVLVVIHKYVHADNIDEYSKDYRYTCNIPGQTSKIYILGNNSSKEGSCTNGTCFNSESEPKY